MYPSISSFSATALRRRDATRASCSFLSRSSTVPLTGSSDTVKQSTLTSAGIFSLSRRQSLSALKFSSQSATSSRCRSISSSRSNIPRATQSCTFFCSSWSFWKRDSARSYTLPSDPTLDAVMSAKKPARSDAALTPLNTCGMEMNCLIAL